MTKDENWRKRMSVLLPVLSLGACRTERNSLGGGRGGARKRTGNEGAIPGCARLNIRASPSSCFRPPHSPALTRTDRKGK